MRLTKSNPETGEYEYIAIARTQEENNARRKAVLQRLGELEDRAEGEWLMCGMFDDLAKCSVCGYSEHSLMEVYDKHFRFCPSCGAKMKGENDEQR